MTQKNYLSNTKAITIKVLSKQETVILSKKMPKAAIAIEKHLAKKKKKKSIAYPFHCTTNLEHQHATLSTAPGTKISNPCHDLQEFRYCQLYFHLQSKNKKKDKGSYLGREGI